MPRRSFLGAAAMATAAGLIAPVARSQPSPPERMALVIGNSRYKASPLASAHNDARLVSSTLASFGFQVNQQLDLTREEMSDLVKQWIDSASNASLRMIYYSGHGAQFRGRNYLLPVDAILKSEDDLPKYAFNFDILADRLSRFERGANLVVLDACRNVLTRSLRSPLGQSGFAPAAAPRGTLIAYATSPGAVAADNPNMGTSLYTRCFVEQLKIPGQAIETVLKRTRAEVMRISRGTQRPTESSSLTGELCISLGNDATCGFSSARR
jgi:uncharacterized caspase-like protein